MPKFLIIRTITILFLVAFYPVYAGAAAGDQSGRDMTIDDLPLLARYAVSETVGRDRPAYHFHKNDHGLHVKNPKHSYSMSFTDRGVELKGDDYKWGLSLVGWGYGKELHKAVPARPEVKTNRVEYKRGDLTEWYVNGPLGLQQGFTLKSPPKGKKPNGGFLRVCLDIRGDLNVKVDPDCKGLSVIGRNGQAPFSYGGLTVIDADNNEIDSWLEVKAGRLFINVDDRKARYPLVIDPIFQSAKLTASDGVAGGCFGYSVAIDGEAIVVGAYGDDDNGAASGSAYVFVKPGGGWSGGLIESAKLTASDGVAGDFFGYSVAIDGEVIVVGAYWDDDNGSSSGSAYVFVKPGGGWTGNLTESAKLTASDGAGSDEFGCFISVDGEVIVVGAHRDDDHGSDSGSAYVFVKPGGGWSGGLIESAKLTASDGAADDQFGSSVSFDVDVIVIGAERDDDHGDFSGSAYVFVRPVGGWSGSLNESAKLTASDGAANDLFGCSVSVDGEVIVVGAEYDDDRGVDSGSAYVFVKPGGGWSGNLTESAKLTASDGAGSDEFGCSISVDGEVIVVGATGDDDHGAASGSAYVFVKPGGGWSGNLNESAKLTGSDGAAYDFFGYSVSVDGDVIVVGAYRDDDHGDSSGSAYVYDLSDIPLLNITLSGGGAGTVTSSPAGIDCPGKCVCYFSKLESVTLTAAPSPGAAFDGWTGVDCPGNGTCTLTMDKDYTVGAIFNADFDGDGVSDVVEDAGPNSGDGNNDGFPDSWQTHASTFKDVSGRWCTLVSGVTLVNVTATRGPNPNNLPADVTPTCGAFGFKIAPLPVGAAVKVTLILHSQDQTINDYWKYGPTPADNTDHWYQFLYNGTTGAEISHEGGKTIITLNLVDGGLGDDDLTANGEITDIGAPASTTGGSQPGQGGGSSGGGGGGGCFIDCIKR